MMELGLIMMEAIDLKYRKKNVKMIIEIMMIAVILQGGDVLYLSKIIHHHHLPLPPIIIRKEKENEKISMHTMVNYKHIQ